MATGQKHRLDPSTEAHVRTVRPIGGKDVQLKAVLDPEIRRTRICTCRHVALNQPQMQLILSLQICLIQQPLKHLSCFSVRQNEFQMAAPHVPMPQFALLMVNFPSLMVHFPDPLAHFPNLLVHFRATLVHFHPSSPHFYSFPPYFRSYSLHFPPTVANFQCSLRHFLANFLSAEWLLPPPSHIWST